MKRIQHILWLIILLSGVGLYPSNATFSKNAFAQTTLPQKPVAPKDTVKVKMRYPVAKTTTEDYEDLIQKSPMDLREPDNLKTTVEYDVKTGAYVVRTMMGNMILSTPLKLTPKEYQDYTFQQSVQDYYREKNDEEFRKAANKQLNLTDMNFDIGPAERIFGKGGIRVKTQGSAEIKLGLKTNKTDNPSLSEMARNRTFFNFDENVQLNVQASVGSKVNFNMNYNTESSFDFDSRQLKLAYEGEEDEIIKSLEAGNVSLQTSNSLINGGAALFGMRADLQFGKLRINALLAQQESESKTIKSKGGAQTKPFEFSADNYDENRHFFLSYYFRNKYNEAMSTLPYIKSSITINRIEVYITNKRSNFDQSRDIVAFSDLAEHTLISNPTFAPSGAKELPYNGSNTLYQTIVNNYTDTRQISKVTQALDGVLTGGKDYEKVESARKLDESEYTLNKQLGYISLKSMLQTDEVLAVAYQYTSGGVVYQVGEFSTDNTESTDNCLYLKLLKGTSMTPQMPFWDLMMKNIYSLGAYAVQKDNFKLDILYQSDTTGVYLNYINEGDIKGKLLLRVLNLDRLDRTNQARPDGFYDFVEGYTILADNGRVIFPQIEPFGESLRKEINNDILADKYVFQELYDSTRTYAKQVAEKNKFIMRGEYEASSGAEISLGSTNVARGSVRVTAAGALLTENVDYSVDYASGIVTILNESIIAAGSPISVSLENQNTYNMQRKTMMGLDLNYQFSKDFTLGGTFMRLSEMPMTTKTVMGDESVQNMLWGLNASYKTESQWLTNMLDQIPLLTLTQPSQISMTAEFANLVAGHYENKQTGGYSYLDDFESTQSGFDLINPYPWQLSSVPWSDLADNQFPEAKLINDIGYGKNRALLAWYHIDGLFTRNNSSLAPKSIRNDKDQLSENSVRAVQISELFPAKEMAYNQTSTLNTLNLAYYPNERGPYNLDATGVNPDGTLMNPEQRFGGITRRLEQSDFETANIEYIEFWMMDPFIDKPTSEGGDLYFNLGEISEDILKDEKKFFENGMPVTGDLEQTEETVWGRVPSIQSTGYAFDNSKGSRQNQDVGLNGLTSEREKEAPSYKVFLEKLANILSATTLQTMTEDPFSPLNDPASDDYHYFRGSDYDAQNVSILDRYKHYNGTEGNSASSDDSNERYSTAAKTLPDVEDLNQDNTLNENESYYAYKVALTPSQLQVGSNHIVSSREANVKLANGTTEKVTWYQFKIPISKPDYSVGSINDFKSIRFMRMYMTHFKEMTVLRFGTFKLVRGEWRTYTNSLASITQSPTSNGSLTSASVSIEEDGERKPVNYVLPPGISRMLDPSQPQLLQQNEQALALQINDLAPADARAVYKNTSYDLRQYKRLQLFAHAEAPIDNVWDLQNNQLSVFLRLGSDYKNNYYEYEIPLKLTPEGIYTSDNASDREIVWPVENLFDFSLTTLTELKLARNKAKRSGGKGVSYQTVYSDYDPSHTLNRISIKGNPSLSNVRTIMIGVRNNSKDIKSGTVWVNELRLTDFNESGGWAANSNLNIKLSDLGDVNVNGHIETAGFGALDQSVSERRMDDYARYNIATNIQFGKFFPEKAKVNLPLYYAYSKETTTPDYNPLDQDIKMKDALNILDNQQDKDSLTNRAVEQTIIKSFSLNNVKVDIKSKTPMPYDPANFAFSYAYSQTDNHNPETEYETTKDFQGSFSYDYTPYAKPFRPFVKTFEKSTGYTKWLQQLSINYLPSNISFLNTMTRNYYEIQLRDLTSTTGENNIPVSFSQNFNWNRAFSMRWKVTNNFSFNFNSGTNARIEEPYVQVNKELEPDKYKIWKDSVKQSIADLGTPLNYDQQFNATLTLPLQYIPALNFANASMTYNATYNWDRGADVSGNVEVGNIIQNQKQFNLQGNMNLLTLYNRIDWLKKINTKYSSRTQNKKAKEERKPVKLIKIITLNTDSGTIVTHGLFTKKIRVSARDTSSKKSYRVKFKTINFGQIEILNKDTVGLELTIRPLDTKLNVFKKESLEIGVRLLMMFRRFNMQYGLTDGMMIPGFRPEIGDIFGQTGTQYGLSPGLGFAFGKVDRGYIDDLSDRGWLVDGTDNVTPAMINSAKTLSLRADLEPWPGLKIDLNANRVDTHDTEIQYMYENSPEIQGGNFTMTTIALRSAFSGAGNAQNGYYSKTFEKFLSNRAIIASRYQNKLTGTTYPNSGFITETTLGGETYDPTNGKISVNSADVLIPAFLAAYTGQDVNSVQLTPFPTLSALLPNWHIQYDGLIRIPTIKRYFKSLNLNHQYRCTYSVGNFSSFLNWVDTNQDDLGYIRDVLTGNPTPSSPYSLSAVSLTEGFSPLLGADATLLNNVTAHAEYRTTRNLNLNISSYQIVESRSNEIVVGLGYKYANFNKILKMKKASNFQNDLTVRLDFSYRRMQSLIRKIESQITQATSGNVAKTLQFSADYGLSRSLTLRGFYDLQINEPLVSSSSYPTSNSNYGVSIRFSLAQ